MAEKQAKPLRTAGRYYDVAPFVGMTEACELTYGFLVFHKDDPREPIASVSYGRRFSKPRAEALRIALAVARSPHPIGTRLPHSARLVDLRDFFSPGAARRLPDWLFGGVMLVGKGRHPKRVPLQPYCPVRCELLASQRAAKLAAEGEPVPLWEMGTDGRARRFPWTDDVVKEMEEAAKREAAASPRPRRRPLVRPVVGIHISGKLYSLRVLRGRLMLHGKPVCSIIDPEGGSLTVSSSATEEVVGGAVLRLIAEVGRQANGRHVPALKLLEL